VTKKMTGHISLERWAPVSTRYFETLATSHATKGQIAPKSKHPTSVAGRLVRGTSVAVPKTLLPGSYPTEYDSIGDKAA
jgi:hypothetical protein